MPGEAGADDALWAHVVTDIAECYLAVFDPFLYAARPTAGKLMYSSIRPFGARTLERVTPDNRSLFRCAYRYDGEFAVVAITDSEIQQVAESFGLPSGTEMDAGLSSFNNAPFVEFCGSDIFISRYSSSGALAILDEISRAYGCEPRDIRLSGGLQLFGGALESAHDIDVVIPIHSQEQARHIAAFPIPSSAQRVCEFGYKWALRWVNRHGTIVCPFFVYTAIEPPVRSVAPAGSLDATLTVEDATYGIFNSPCYAVRGGVDLLLFRATLVRGFIAEGQALPVRAPVYSVTEGGCRGARVAVVTNPWDQVLGFGEEVLSGWRS